MTDRAGQGAVVLLSGGLDSTTTLAIAKADGFSSYAMSFRYGQRHAVELESAKCVAQAMGVVEHAVVDVDLCMIGGSALTGDLVVPKSRSLEEMGEGIPLTYVPARNTIFLSFAVGWAEVLGASGIYIGVNALDYSGYPDCRPEFLEAFETLADKATKAGVEGRGRFRVHAPLLHMSKREIVERAVALGVPLARTWTCYEPDAAGRACGRCDACVLRLEGFREAGLAD
ncbi:MAG TPA: 7-cyano-7-deazaguanine synthase QueC, partial [Methylococcaceae bacterium]|nr:7-cyano-7-deazaguanine synthase QueC [Methylococcaceae bacterium]